MFLTNKLKRQGRRIVNLFLINQSISVLTSSSRLQFFCPSPIKINGGEILTGRREFSAFTAERHQIRFSFTNSNVDENGF
jgi:hypothetical protein